MDKELDVVVVGAGLAGLTAARRLVERGLSVRVLEARDRVGGRIYSRSLDEDGFIDLGGQWIGPGQDRIAALAEELGVETFPTFAEGEPKYEVNGGTSAEAEGADAALRDLNAMAAELPVGEPWLAERASEWDSQTLHSWLESRQLDPTSMATVRLLATSVFTAEPAELSLLHVLTYIRSAGSLGMLTVAAQKLRFVGGAQTVAQRAAAALPDGVLHLSCPVESITQTASGVDVVAGSVRVAARQVIVAVPIALVDRIAFEPPLPADRAQLHQRVAPGTTFKIHCVYDTPFWRDDGWSGQCVSDEGLVSVAYDNSPPSGQPGILVGFVEADSAREFARLSDDARRKEVTDCFVSFFGPAAANVRDYVELDWSSEEWTRGCYGSNLSPGTWSRYGAALRQSVGRVHWAGAETSTVWMNYMDGAVRSGERAAGDVAAALNSRA